MGALCACDAELAKCIAVRAVVASSTKRSCVMVMRFPGKVLQVGLAINRSRVRPDCGVRTRCGPIYFSTRNASKHHRSLRIQTHVTIAENGLREISVWEGDAIRLHCIRNSVVCRHSRSISPLRSAGLHKADLRRDRSRVVKGEPGAAVDFRQRRQRP